MIETHRLAVDDWPLWREVRLAALAEAPHAFGSTLAQWQGEGDHPERWRARLATEGSHHVLALTEGRPVGMASGMPTDDPGAAELMSMWVSPTVRGQGAGDLLIADVEHWARERHLETLRLAVFPDNTAALALYQRAGFTPSGERDRQLPNGPTQELVMTKRLTST